MAEELAIAAQLRTVIGKSGHRLQKAGLIPAVLYGAGRESTSITVDRHDFELFMQHHEGSGGLVQIALEGETKPVAAMLKQIQHSPIKGTIVHVDFLAVRMDQVTQAPVNLHFVGDAVGVKSGGVLLHELREVTLEALPADLPDFIDVDVTDMELGSTVHVSDIILPKGVSIIDDPEQVVCSVTTPTAEPTEDEIAASAEEVQPEVIGESEEAAE
ncbi:MAG: 50S ribosomal protein L25 [Actinobacteria bacterium]|nr:50S ribosomal protein L25 [Actinomycetota bacterium]MCG2806684.1 50S ribosomal protein L25 [Coriobacteriia bacterium]